MPALSVVICTRDRGLRVLDTVRSIVADSCTTLEVLIVDQSADASVKDALAAFDGDQRIRYVRTDTRGLSAARNLGLRLAEGAVVAMTDDDCTVAHDWAAAIEVAFAQHPDVVLLFGNVAAAPFDPVAGFIPHYERSSPFLATDMRQKLHVEGIGACMAVRRSMVVALGGFDEMLGAGGRFQAGEDVDLTLRVLASGQAVYETPAVQVVHAGFHEWSTGPAVIHSYWFGAGAAYGKHLRLRGVRALRLIGRLGWRFLMNRSSVVDNLDARGLSRLRLRAFVQGFRAGASTRVDRATGLFVR